MTQMEHRQGFRVQEPFTAESAEIAEPITWLRGLGGLCGERLWAPVRRLTPFHPRSNWERSLCALALVLCVSGAACSRSAPAADRTPVDASALFAQACAKCHAADGTGGLPMAVNGPRPTDLTTAEWQRSRSDAELVYAIRNGRGAMPPFQDVLSSPQIDALGAYVRALQRP